MLDIGCQLMTANGQSVQFEALRDIGQIIYCEVQKGMDRIHCLKYLQIVDILYSAR